VNSTRPKRSTLWLPVLLMVVFAMTRWPGILPENFSAAYALAFCAGIYLGGAMAWWLPLGTLLLTSVLLNVFAYGFPAFDRYTVFSLLGFAALVGMGRCFKPRNSFATLLASGLLGAVLFYLVTNTLSWLYEPTQPYPKTLAGWLQALTRGTAGWPETWTFFRNTLLSSGLFTGLFVGSMKVGEFMEQEALSAPHGEESEEIEEGEEEKEARPF